MGNGKVGRLTVVLLVCAWGPSGFGQMAAPQAGAQTIPLIRAGTPVVFKARETVLRADGRVVATGEVHRVYRVGRVHGDWLWVAADGLGGWVRAAEVLPLDQAADYYSEVIRRRPESAWAFLMRGMIWYDRRDYDRALADYSAAVALDPKSALAYHDRGDAHLARTDYDKAVADYNEATRLDPSYAPSYANRALAWAALREYDLAIADDNEAIRLDPNDVAKYHHRASCWIARREYERALADYDAALALDPNDATAYQGRGWVRATADDPHIRDGQKAVEAATRACALTRWRDPYCLETLAAAEAEAGNFGAAVRWQAAAIGLFRRESQDDESHHRRLALYQTGKPYRDGPNRL